MPGIPVWLKIHTTPFSRHEQLALMLENCIENNGFCRLRASILACKTFHSVSLNFLCSFFITARKWSVSFCQLSPYLEVAKYISWKIISINLFFILLISKRKIISLLHIFYKQIYMFYIYSINNYATKFISSCIIKIYCVRIKI